MKLILFNILLTLILFINDSSTCSSSSSGKRRNPDKKQLNPCKPSPCGANAECIPRNGIGTCNCILNYQGNPYEECRPECVLSSDCSTCKACIRNKCVNPCPGSCGQNTECSVTNHTPICTCMRGFIGDPFTGCTMKLS